MTKREPNLHQQLTDNDLIGTDGELRRPASVPMADDIPGTYDKKQDRFRPRSPELHFTTSLYIDGAVELLRSQPAKTGNRQGLPIIQCDVTSVDSDRARFKLEALRMGKTTGRLEGTMQRWQGSLTRVDVDVQQFSHDVERRATLTVGAMLGLGVIGAAVMAILCMQALGVPPEKSTPPLAAVFGVLALAALAFHEDIIQPRFRRTRITDAIVQRDVDELTEVLTSIFGEYDLQWINQ
ncbi:MAG: hypothetical protein KJ064_08040 [Anaerolineae bacterium]|nr:hypothetical protein [Anaerolineae bacterium]